MNVPVLFSDNVEVSDLFSDALEIGEYDEDGYKIIKYHLIGTGMHLRFHIDELIWLDPEGRETHKGPYARLWQNSLRVLWDTISNLTNRFVRERENETSLPIRKTRQYKENPGTVGGWSS